MYGLGLPAAMPVRSCLCLCKFHYNKHAKRAKMVKKMLARLIRNFGQDLLDSQEIGEGMGHLRGNFERFNFF
jgi:hypothetical protein